MSQRTLFGGAISIVLPTNLLDASDIRQVPDTQEVFVSRDSDISFVVEILERVPIQNPDEAARFHFDSLAHDNDAQSHIVHEVQVPSAQNAALSEGTPLPIILDGSQAVTKFNRTTADDVRILLALFRIENKNVDLVLSVNIPTVAEDGTAVPPSGIESTREVFMVAASSLRVLDFDLFV
ncbi:Mog1p/PsbP-like protein [Rickenella mellea]|uniref:Mog1p/PsbP-like protein n=1 Tax=Rickenella mellea TaxID=50990 RepID=A0A4Y7QJX3_9AGAM|nr:Mog1p/PsbP-like protein [Rickenella mellea]